MKIAFPDSIRARRCLPTLIAVSGSLVALPASALELGDLTIQSRLGQPLRASIAYALAPDEQLSNACISLRPGKSFGGMPNVGRASISVAHGVITLTGNTPIREPMISVQLTVSCPYSANIVREYTLFVDPASLFHAAPAINQETVAQSDTVTPATTAAPIQASAVARRKPVQRDLEESTRYQVQHGDSLTQIVQRIENRSVAFWPAVNAIFVANPDAFMDSDPNKLKAGSWLSIPALAASGPVRTVSIAEPAVTAAPVAKPEIEPVIAVEPEIVTVIAVEPEIEPVIAVEPDITPVRAGVTTGDLKPGDIILDTQLEGPVTTSTSPNVATAIIRETAPTAIDAPSRSWLMWLAGSGVAIVFTLLLFGRRPRGSATPRTPVGDQSRRGITDVDDELVDAIDEHELSDDSPTVENLALDADLIIGTGLAEGTEVDLAQDFGFAQTTALDIELPFESIAPVSDATDILAPLSIEESSILKAEVLPENDDYDMSIIMDATKIPRPEDVTERDLQAIEINVGNESMMVENYTISQDVDYRIIEQDYEDEMTATQRLNEEIARAATELEQPIDTAELSLASVTELDVTAQLPEQEVELSDLDDTGINEALTVNMTADDNDDGDTVEMPAKSGKAG